MRCRPTRSRFLCGYLHMCVFFQIVCECECMCFWVLFAYLSRLQFLLYFSLHSQRIKNNTEMQFPGTDKISNLNILRKYFFLVKVENK